MSKKKKPARRKPAKKKVKKKAKKPRPKKKTPDKIDPAAMTREQFADLLSVAAGGEIPVDAVDLIVDQGAPVNEDGTLNLLNLTAWAAGRVS